MSGRCRASFGSFSGPASRLRIPRTLARLRGRRPRGRRRERRLGDRLLCGTAARGARPVPGASVCARALDHELGIRRRRLEELGAASDGPAEWVRRIRDPDKPPRAERSFDVAHDVDLRPDRAAHYGAFDLTLGSEAREAIRSEIGAASPLKVETGGFLFAHQRRLFFADICHASGPAPNSRHGRTSVMVGEVCVPAEFGEFTQRADLAIGCWHSQPWGDGEPSRADLNVWRTRLEASGWDQYIGVIATPTRTATGGRSLACTPGCSSGTRSIRAVTCASPHESAKPERTDRCAD